MYAAQLSLQVAEVSSSMALLHNYVQNYIPIFNCEWKICSLDIHFMLTKHMINCKQGQPPSNCNYARKDRAQPVVLVHTDKFESGAGVQACINRQVAGMNSSI